MDASRECSSDQHTLAGFTSCNAGGSGEGGRQARTRPEGGCDEEARTASPPPPAPPGEEVPEGARGLAWRETSRCERASLVLHHVRLRHAMEREKHAEQAAGEAMGRLMRAFVLLCLLRIILAQQQRRRMLIDRDRAPTWDRAVNV